MIAFLLKGDKNHETGDKKSAYEQLKEFKAVLDPHLKDYMENKVKESFEISLYTGELTEYISDLTLRGGKRVRAALLYYSYLAHGGKNKEEVIKAAMAMELAETFLLIHDDIMDDDQLRRGGETIHESYDKKCRAKYRSVTNGCHHFGQSMALLAGDIAAAMSNEILASCDFKKESINRAVVELNKIYVIECYGQALDMFSQVREDLTKDDVILTHQLKTVPYTFDGPVKLGALLAGASDKEIKSLEGYSVPLGIAFQIQDDILGLFGSEEKLGKPVTSDLREGKKTLLMLDALKQGNQEQKDIIGQNLGNKKATMKSLLEVREVVRKTGALKTSAELAKKLAIESAESIKQLSLTKSGKAFLVDLAEYVVNREY